MHDRFSSHNERVRFARSVGRWIRNASDAAGARLILRKHEAPRSGYVRPIGYRRRVTIDHEECCV